MAETPGASHSLASRNLFATVARKKVRLQITDQATLEAAVISAHQALQSGDHLTCIDIYEQLCEMFPDQSTALLAELYEIYEKIPNKGNRYSLYVSRDFDFRIQPGEKVLDVGSGHDPFPLATHLADFAPDDDSYGRAGIAMKFVEGKPFTACNVESMPFKDQEFDFIYCSHVLEHTESPEKACEELMRVAKRGYIETPTRGKDLWLNSAGVSNHFWAVENFNGKLIFSQYTALDKVGIGSGILMDMHCSPQTTREKAFSALVLLKSLVVNTCLYWEGRFDYEVRRL